ncbi:MAG: hypothetical protein Q7W44_06570 [Coriobacteriia bacterium]|nr:hypothetical protein [Coriobacteriia bacterium]
MSDSTGTPATANRTMLILLGAIVVLLLAIVVIFLARGNADSGPTVTASTDTAATAGAPSGMPGATAPAVEFDPATATTVPAGETPEAYVVAYFDAIVAGDYATAYGRLPTDKKASSTEQQFADQLTGYGVTEYTIDDVTEADGEAQVLATASMAGGQFQYLWTFVAEGDGWLVKSRTLPGMGQ